jgi:hypothetical protein
VFDIRACDLYLQPSQTAPPSQHGQAGGDHAGGAGDGAFPQVKPHDKPAPLLSHTSSSTGVIDGNSKSFWRDATSNRSGLLLTTA